MLLNNEKFDVVLNINEEWHKHKITFKLLKAKLHKFYLVDVLKISRIIASTIYK